MLVNLCDIADVEEAANAQNQRQREALSAACCCQVVYACTGYTLSANVSK